MSTYTKSTRLTSRMIRALGDGIAPRDKSARRLCILNFHRILKAPDPLIEGDPDVKTFRWQMALLADCFNVMSLADAIQALNTGSLPPRAVCITFDDGYRSTHDLALPILKEFNLPATVFVTSGHVGESSMWNDRIVEAIRQIPGDNLDLRDMGMGVHPLKTAADRKHAAKALTQASKYLLVQPRLDLAMKLEELAGGAASNGLMLTREMLITLTQQGIEIGAHTITHPILTSIDDQSARDEIVGSKRQLEEMIGKPVIFFAYPNGKAHTDFDERHVQMTKDAGFAAAFASTTGTVTKMHDLFQIPRTCPWDATPFLFGLRLLRWLANR